MYNNSMEKTEIVHKDCLGRALKVGDCVAVAHHNQLMVATVKKINPKMIKVARVGSNSRSSGHNKYPSECALLEGPEVTMFLLKMSV